MRKLLINQFTEHERNHVKVVLDNGGLALTGALTTETTRTTFFAGTLWHFHRQYVLLLGIFFDFIKVGKSLLLRMNQCIMQKCTGREVHVCTQERSLMRYFLNHSIELFPWHPCGHSAHP